MVRDTQKIDPLNRKINGVEILSIDEIENSPSYSFLKGEQLEGNRVWLSPVKSFSPLTDLELSFYLLTTLILAPFIYLGFQHSIYYGYAGVFLLSLLLGITLNRYDKIRKHYLHQKLDKKEYKKGMLFDQQFLYFNEGDHHVIYKINLNVVQHLQFYSEKKENRFEWVAEGKVIIDDKIDAYENKWKEIIPFLIEFDVKLLNYEDL